MPDLSTTAAGIPCRIRILSYTPADPGRLFGPPEHCWPPAPEEMEWELRDRRGYPAPWLERKLTQSERAAIEQEIADWMKEEEADYEPDY